VAKYTYPVVLGSLVLLVGCAPYEPLAPRYAPVAPPPIYPEPRPAATEQHQRQVAQHGHHRAHKRVVRRKVIHEETTTAPAEAVPAPNPR
jgi:hypothetical protein